MSRWVCGGTEGVWEGAQDCGAANKSLLWSGHAEWGLLSQWATRARAAAGKCLPRDCQAFQPTMPGPLAAPTAHATGLSHRFAQSGASGRL